MKKILKQLLKKLYDKFLNHFRKITVKRLKSVSVGPTPKVQLNCAAQCAKKKRGGWWTAFINQNSENGINVDDDKIH